MSNLVEGGNVRPVGMKPKSAPLILKVLGFISALSLLTLAGSIVATLITHNPIWQTYTLGAVMVFALSFICIIVSE